MGDKSNKKQSTGSYQPVEDSSGTPPVKKNFKIKESEISGDPSKDFEKFESFKDYDFGIKMLEYYVPRNINLIEYLKFTKDMNYLLFNLKVITNARR